MSILCWNCRGLGNPRAVGTLRFLRRTRRPRLLFLSETLASKEEMEVLRLSLRYGGCFTVANQGHSGGLALLWEDELQVSLLSFSKNHIDVSIDNWGSNQWRFTGFYGFPATSERHRT